MLNYSPEQILSFAPDPGSAKAGRALAIASKWQNVGNDARAIWGECQGSGARPYQTVIDLNEPAFKCSCPSRKFPCKHALGLFLLVATNSAISNTSATAPAWAAEWLAKRDEQGERRAAVAKQAEIEPDAETLARRETQKVKRSLARETKVAGGLIALELWLRDLIRHGLAAAQTRSVEYWEQMAARLIDAQAPGLARKVRGLSQAAHYGDGWTSHLLTQLSSLFLLLRAYDRLDSLPGTTQADVRTAIGWSYKEDELPEENSVVDLWLVLGQRTVGDEGLRVRRTWLWGQQMSKGALLLEFAVQGQYFTNDFIPGKNVEAELVFYPSNYPLRAALKERKSVSHVIKDKWGYENSDQLLTNYSEALALNPWTESLPAPIQSLIPIRRGEQWFARDNNGQLLTLRGGSTLHWKLLALSGGHPITMFGEWNGQALLPVSAWTEGRYFELQS
jgi:hypothetical protein